MERQGRASRWVGHLLRALGYATAAFVFWLLAVWPPPSWYRLHFPQETAFMAMRRRAGSGGPEHRYQPVALDRIAASMHDAVIVAEDQRFYAHDGLDFQAIREAMGYRRDSFAWAEPADRAELQRALGSAWSRRERMRGASTITQQLAKNLYLSPSRNPLRKLKEAVTAYRLEAALSKRRILELYLNVVELGPEVWGVEAASRAYFRRSASGLSAEQGALLAATLPSPLRANPGLRPGRIRWRQDLILRRMRGERVVIPPPEAELPELPLIPPIKLDTIIPPVVDTGR
jgi:monofunctional biosynthetic peptidoglycan transglycosylase